ncbi:hypothetical protein AA0119_g13627 [Alternaria tenuissima]|uniref:SMP domain-containing protein n=1 Tax=Alternaria tenuissima TaxID=119927 RepID=A0ABY0FNF2_9PLEO|nr:hypothetical protein AA0119_g13627 [Alternaria tenuissima]
MNSKAGVEKSGQFTSPPSVISRNGFEANSEQAKTDPEHLRSKQATSNNTARPHRRI